MRESRSRARAVLLRPASWSRARPKAAPLERAKHQVGPAQRGVHTWFRRGSRPIQSNGGTPKFLSTTQPHTPMKKTRAVRQRGATVQFGTRRPATARKTASTPP